MGGVGKTQLALSYAHSRKNIYKATFWITAINESSVIYSFREIAQRLVDWAAEVRGSAVNFTRITYELGLGQFVDNTTGEVRIVQGHEQARIDAIRRWLSKDENKGWLLVYDSANDLESIVLPSLFPTAPNGDILVTSRQRHSSLLGENLELKCLALNEATELLMEYGSYREDQGPLLLFPREHTIMKRLYGIANPVKR